MAAFRVCLALGVITLLGCGGRVSTTLLDERIDAMTLEQLRHQGLMEERIARIEESYNDRISSLEARIQKLDDLLIQISERTIMASALGIAVPKDVSDHLNKARCHANQRVLEGAVAVYMADHGGTLPRQLSDLLEARLIREIPLCPADSSAYQYDSSNGQVRCSNHPR
jgi:hypothetical protein